MKHLTYLIFFLAALSLASCGMKSEKSSTQMESQSTTTTTAEVIHLNTMEFVNKMNTLENVQVIDVRTPGEIAEGKIQGALEMDYRSGVVSQRLDELDKEKPVMVYCRSGGRSAASAAIFKEAGFKQTYNLKGAGYQQLSQAVK